MPGIAGIIRQYPYEGIDRDLQAMVQSLRHEDHHCGGQYVDADLGLYVGWMCHRGTFADRMPLVGGKNDVVLIFSGENYIHRETFNQSRQSSRKIDALNASYLLDMYLELGDQFFTRLNGWYCGVIADRRNGQITIFNDRFGMARLYVHEGKDEYLFGSEAKCLLAVRSELRNVAPEGLAEYLRFNCVSRGRTLFRGVSLFPGGSRWAFRKGSLADRRQYFSFKEWEGLPKLQHAEFYRQFADTVSRVCPTYARASQGVGLSLTAGLDTRAIIAALSSQKQPLPCYTFGGMWGELLDIRTARKLAAAYGQQYATIRVDKRFLKDFPAFAARTIYVSDGTHDAFGAHDLYLNKLARHVAPVRLTGKFGSEVVRNRKLVPLIEYRDGLLEPSLSSLVKRLPTFGELSEVRNPLTRVLTEEIPCHEYGRLAIEQSQVVLRTPYMDNDLVRLMFQAPDAVRATGDLQERYVRDVAPELAVFPTNLGRFVADNRLLTRLFYLQLRALFKMEYVYLYAAPHWLTRLDRKLEALHLERILVGRQKWEAYRLWIRTDFSDFVSGTLLNPQAKCAEFFEKKSIERVVTRHIKGTHNYLDEINRMLSVELMCSSLLST